MKNLYRLIKRPLVTEKSSVKKAENQVVLEVSTNANKSEIKKAVEKIFKVTVIGINTINFPGKKKRVGKSLGRRPAWKKAYIKLKEGENIEFFEGM
ncbi:MAG: 50S ribosomal protein L23 [Thermodesulfobacteriota bacterium]